MNWTEVALGFIASLNVKTTCAIGETPVAKLDGETDTMVGWAANCPALIAAQASPKSQRKRRMERGHFNVRFLSATAF